MADTDTAETAETEAPASTEENGNAAPTVPDRLPDDHPLVKAYQATKSELTNAKSKVKEFEDATKTEQERLTEKATTLETELTTAQANAARFEIALEKGLTKSQAKRLVGSTREELEADADELLSDLGVGATSEDEEEPAKKPATRPKEALKSGAAPATTPPDVSPGMGRLRAAYANSDQ